MCSLSVLSSSNDRPAHHNVSVQIVPLCLCKYAHRTASPSKALKPFGCALAVIDDASDPCHTLPELPRPRHAQVGLLSFAKVNPSRGPFRDCYPLHFFPLRKRTASAWCCCARYSCLPTVTTSTVISLFVSATAYRSLC